MRSTSCQREQGELPLHPFRFGKALEWQSPAGEAENKKTHSILSPEHSEAELGRTAQVEQCIVGTASHKLYTDRKACSLLGH